MSKLSAPDLPNPIILHKPRRTGSIRLLGQVPVRQTLHSYLSQPVVRHGLLDLGPLSSLVTVDNHPWLECFPWSPLSTWCIWNLHPEHVAGCLFFHMDCLSPLFQGRAGSDGARGMPGQTGPKVGHHPHPYIYHHPWRHVDDITIMFDECACRECLLTLMSPVECVLR